MKKLLAVLLCVLMVFCFTACKDTDTASTPKSATDVDIVDAVKSGKIPEGKYTLGDDYDTLFNELTNNGEDVDGMLYQRSEEGEFSVLSDAEGYSCYFITEEKDKGMVAIVTFGDAFGFSHSTMTSEVLDALKAQGIKAEEESADSDDIFFMPSSVGYTQIECEIADNTVIFVFQDSLLCATALCGDID